MFRNRIRQYTRALEESETGAAAGSAPPGFAAVPLTHLPPAMQQAARAQSQLYQLAYEQARKSLGK
jgi:hypothetical protein